ncbi:helix-turn-helix domain-containing protein [Brevundimonas sp. 2R-24]|uniref:Helix-turn-helix domain-containing protein n=1 Tax=Peiella sedimenti TaxID=3061083 RepID=A0ABT8SNF3_9CAUL|nr:helix-turn-helix domain-containing protein [Caulobacteraceae bacterium XZ-24]
MSEAPDPLDAAVGVRIRMRRTTMGLTQTQLGRALDLSMQQIQKYERGATRVSGRTLLRIAKELDCTVAWLVGEEETQDTPLMAQLMLPGADRLLEAYAALPNSELRTAVVKLVRSMAQPKNWISDGSDHDD